MEHSLELLLQTASCSIFCLAIAFFLHSSFQTNQLLRIIKNNINDNMIVYEQNNEIAENITIDQKELVAILMEQLEYDVDINGLYIEASTHHPLNFDFSRIAKGTYSITYDYLPNGNFSKIIYTKQ